ncbi:hypothetical protein SS1G_10590 [Sclerotinia sclerotiorum 1980 UF-70]|uniref:O-acyltransferase n=1 Tax=Sclerotinia sclerotiorum (strain ATCC 18683 / 1980 / Ss-1) TaxID=665079 RepID=A7EZ24_SCLS1|nr:hypothetical protein SS1G_10590 [Sclerotinia sclerotiorum 1980 UF-70]EDN94716.1 hypothetical protein SS1G_10590 [Sclerotinia sclerotiorum 1980 UF-70]
MASTTALPLMTTVPSSNSEHPVRPSVVGKSKENGVNIPNSKRTQKPSTDPKYSSSLKIALETVARNRRDSLDVSESDSLEDYDTLKPDPMSIITGGKGGGLDTDTGTATEITIPQTVYAELKIPFQQSRKGVAKRKNIPVTLKKLQKGGGRHYTFETDDAELRDLLKDTVAHYSQDKKPGQPKHKSKFSDLVFTKKFTAFDRHNNIIAESPFHGFLTLAWLAFVVFVLQLAFANWRTHGNILGTNEIMEMMFHRDVIVLGLSDGAWELLYLALVVSWTLFREWPWTHTVFFVLHGLVMMMKQHSYAFYNGYLSEEYQSRLKLQRKLKQLESISPVQTPSATTPAVASLSTSYLDARPTSHDVHQRISQRTLSIMESTIDQVAAAVDSCEPLDLDQIQTFARILKWEIDFLSKELEGKCTASKNQYPSNLTLANHYEYIVLPTLVYELEYPRSDNIDWYNVAEKAIATVGLLIVMNLISQTYIYPIVVQTIRMKESDMTPYERLLNFPGIVSDLAFPFLAEYILVSCNASKF